MREKYAPGMEARVAELHAAVETAKGLRNPVALTKARAERREYEKAMTARIAAEGMVLGTVGVVEGPGGR